MVWSSVRYKGAIGLECVYGSMDARYYTIMLKKGLLPAFTDAMGDI